MHLKNKIDWLTLTVPDASFGIAIGQNSESIKPINGYNTALKDKDTGIIAQRHTERQDMGLNLIMSGKALDALRAKGADDAGVIRWLTIALRNDAQVSRLDMALDVCEADLNPSNIRSWHEKGLIKPRARKFTWYDSHKVGDERHGRTYYMGSRTSDSGFVRAYDKGVESGSYDDVLRLEYQFRKRKTTSVIHDADWRGVFRTTISALNHFLRPSDECPLSDIFAFAPHRHASNRPASDFDSLYQFLVNTCVPALKRAERERPGTVIDIFKMVGIDGMSG